MVNRFSFQMAQDNKDKASKSKDRTQIRFYKLILMVLTFAFAIYPSFGQQNNGLSKSEVTRIKQHILEIINQQRRSQGLRDVELDAFASKVAEEHAWEMARGNYTSHWNEQGLKPYVRYGKAGGMDAVMENVAGKWSNAGFAPENVADIIEQFQMAMFYEKPPRDEHRRNILQPQHTHVGLGIAYTGGRIQFAEEFVARYIQVDSIPDRLKAGDIITLKGELLYDKTDIHNIDIFYEPFPQALTPDQLNRTDLYSFPKDRLTLRVKAKEGYSYPDGTTGIIDYDPTTGKFSTPIDFKGARPGIYTIIVWVKLENRPFPATNIYVEVH